MASTSGSNIRIEELLVKAGVISAYQLKTARIEQDKWGGEIGDILVRMQYLTEDVLVRAISKIVNVPRADLTRPVPQHILETLNARFAEEKQVLPLAFQDDGKTVIVAMADPSDLKLLDQVRAQTRRKVVPQIAGKSQLQSTISRLYGGADFSDESVADEAFSVVSNQGHAVATSEIPPVQTAPPPAPAPAPLARLPMERRVTPRPTPAPDPSVNGLADLVRAIGEAQRTEAKVLMTIVELLIEKGFFSRDEYLDRVRR